MSKQSGGLSKRSGQTSLAQRLSRRLGRGSIASRAIARQVKQTAYSGSGEPLVWPIYPRRTGSGDNNQVSEQAVQVSPDIREPSGAPISGESLLDRVRHVLAQHNAIDEASSPPRPSWSAAKPPAAKQQTHTRPKPSAPQAVPRASSGEKRPESTVEEVTPYSSQPEPENEFNEVSSLPASRRMKGTISLSQSRQRKRQLSQIFAQLKRQTQARRRRQTRNHRKKATCPQGPAGYPGS